MVTDAPNQPAATAIQQQFRRDELLPLLPGVLWQVEAGVVRTTTWDEAGTLVVLGIWGVGQVVGQPLTTIAPYQIECLTSVEVRLLPQAEWGQTLDALLQHCQQLEEFQQTISYNPVPLRLWQLLLFLAQEFGRDMSQGRLIELVLTHQQLAEAINTTRVTVTRALQQFEQEGKLLKLKKQLIVCHSSKS